MDLLPFSQCSDKLGLSLELGSFVAGVMISTTDFAQHTLDQVIVFPGLVFSAFLQVHISSIFASFCVHLTRSLSLCEEGG